MSAYAQSVAGDVILEARNLWYSYDNRAYALQGADFEVRRGKMVMILGRSGSGKSTLLRTLKGLVKPQKGEVAYRGSRIAYIPQTLGLVRNMTALENTLSGALADTGTLRSMLRWFPARTVAEARATLASLGIADKCDRKVYDLSGGERQRVAIARSLLQKADLILADEFVSQLDPITADEILSLVRKLAGQGVAFLVTTHELDLVQNYADEYAIVHGGRVVQRGAASEADTTRLRRLIQGETAHL